LSIYTGIAIAQLEYDSGDLSFCDWQAFSHN
jgi:hypothetical protein